MRITESMISLFESANILTLCLWAAGAVLFAVEFFQPMHGLSYSVGLSLLLSAFITAMLHGSPGEAFMFVLLTVSALYVVHVIALITQKRDWLRVSRLERAAGTRARRLGSLVGKTGVAITPIDVTGSVNVDDVNLAVYCETPVAIGQRVRITRVSHDRITVEPAEITEDN